MANRLPDAHPRHQRRAGNACLRLHFVNDSRVGDEAPAARYVPCNLIGNHAAEVADVLVDGLLLVDDHLFRDGEDTAGDRLSQSAPSDDGIEVEWDVAFLQFLDDDLLAEVELVGYALEYAQLFLGVGNVCHKYRLVVVCK